MNNLALRPLPAASPSCAGSNWRHSGQSSASSFLPAGFPNEALVAMAPDFHSSLQEVHESAREEPRTPVAQYPASLFSSRWPVSRPATSSSTGPLISLSQQQHMAWRSSPAPGFSNPNNFVRNTSEAANQSQVQARQTRLVQAQVGQLERKVKADGRLIARLWNALSSRGFSDIPEWSFLHDEVVESKRDLEAYLSSSAPPMRADMNSTPRHDQRRSQCDDSGYFSAEKQGDVPIALQYNLTASNGSLTESPANLDGFPVGLPVPDQLTSPSFPQGTTNYQIDHTEDGFNPSYPYSSGPGFGGSAGS